MAYMSIDPYFYGFPVRTIYNTVRVLVMNREMEHGHEHTKRVRRIFIRLRENKTQHVGRLFNTFFVNR